MLTWLIYLSCDFLVRTIWICIAFSCCNRLFLKTVVFITYFVLKITYLEAVLTLWIKHCIANLYLDICIVDKPSFFLNLFLLFWFGLLRLVGCFFTTSQKLLVIEFFKNLSSLSDLVSLSKPIFQFLFFWFQIILKHSVFRKSPL